MKRGKKVKIKVRGFI